MYLAFMRLKKRPQKPFMTCSKPTARQLLAEEHRTVKMTKKRRRVLRVTHSLLLSVLAPPATTTQNRWWWQLQITATAQESCSGLEKAYYTSIN
jgi:hypothetical protein